MTDQDRIYELEQTVSGLERQLQESRAQRIAVNAWGVQLIEALGSFLTSVTESDGPLTTEIVCRFPDMTEHPVVHLWATTDHNSPVTRCKELRGRVDELERLVRALRRAEGRRSRCEERFDSAIDTRWPAACEAAAEELEQARQAVDAARAALFAAVGRKGK